MTRKKKQYLQLKINIQLEKPPVWRRVVVPAAFRLDQLHALIQIAFGWHNEHLHHFWSTDTRRLLYVPRIDPDLQVTQQLTNETDAFPLLKKADLIYEYDFGDSWDHVIHLEDVLQVSDLGGRQAPFCLTGRRPGKQENSRGQKQNEGAPFNKAAINQSLRAAFPKETAMPVQYRFKVADEAKTTPVPPATSAPNQDAWSKDKLLSAAGELLGADSKKVYQTADTLWNALTNNQMAAASQTELTRIIVRNQLVLFKVGQKDDSTIHNRLAFSGLSAALLANDAKAHFLPKSWLNGLFDQAERLVASEKNMALLPNMQTGSRAALKLLKVAVEHPDYDNARASDQIPPALEKMFENIEAPFQSDEPERIAGIVVELAGMKAFPPDLLTALLRLMSLTQDIAWREDGGTHPEPFFRLEAWQHVLTILDVMLTGLTGYQEVGEAVHKEVKARLLKMYNLE
ncbi:IS1096 element passenger TnpR family protein [Schleiferilactobacillus shenzhenensis]|uniref:Plasmid pRiA4b Orf3-like domain-containing protein n=1 Tax=Schleiferilactobacillus shenzhenensis LY-73 TaxID=1231336 RepID=U4TGH5_9LACO|nr:DUF2785 domain-containing protein [Schleiferilactobacillus shenzhenensis]ERL63861.1 hypothetical protein L248_2095 [Schleiferilactobacillus shenzhenensis LY-73]